MIWAPSCHSDVGLLARTMRLSDMMEVRTNAMAFGRMGPSWTLEFDLHETFAHAQPWTLWDRGNMVGMGGVAPIPHAPHVGSIWFLGTALADLRWIGMTKACMKMKAYGDKHFELIGNIVPECMERRIAWLEYLGFDIDRDKANCPDGYVAFWSHSDGPKDGPAAL
jgi:hypothetical protein